MYEIIEFEYDKGDSKKLMHRVTFIIHGYADAQPRRIFLDPWIEHSYSGEKYIVDVYEAAAEGTVRAVERTYISQPWRQYRNFPFFFVEEVDISFILPSGKNFVTPFGVIRSQSKSTSVGAAFMIRHQVKVKLNTGTGKGIIYINEEPLDCALIISGPVRPEVQWSPREPLKDYQTMPGGYAQHRLEVLRAGLKRNE